MNFSRKYRSILLLSLFFISLIFQLLYTFNALSGKQILTKNQITNLIPNKNNTGDNLLVNFIEEETEDGDEFEFININVDLLLSFLRFEFLNENLNQKIAFHTSLPSNYTPIFLEIRNIRI